MNIPVAEQRRRFVEAYGEHRSAEGHGARGDAELLALPFVRGGPLARSWSVRARTYQVFLNVVVDPLARHLGRKLVVLDAGAGNGWLSYRLTRRGHVSTALDLRATGGDSLQSSRAYRSELPAMFWRIAADFTELPQPAHHFDVIAFNASLHYALDLAAVLSEATRVLRPAGRIAVLDSPFYDRREYGEAMVAEKRQMASHQFGERRESLMSLPFIEYLTLAGLREASQDLGLAWSRHRVRYPLHYEVRPWIAALRRRRTPSRFDLWVGTPEGKPGA